MERTLSVAIITKVETPSPRQGPMTFPTSGMFFTLRRSLVRLPVKKRSTHTAPTAWLMTVAVAAPRTPILRAKIRMGSRMMLHTAPITVVIMLNVAKPWVVTKGFMPITMSTKMVPMI